MEALDLEGGIGYGSSSMPDGSPLLRGIEIGSRQAPYRMGLNEFQNFLLQKVLDCARSGKDEVELLPTDLPASRNIDEMLPDSFTVTVSLVADSPNAVNEGQFELVFKGGAGPSSAKMLGRFCSASPALNSLVRAALGEEESHDPDAVFAEIVYLPEGRVGNVLCRPVLRDYEIVHLGRSGARPDKQLRADDFLVSIREGKIILYSKKLARRVIPRLSNAHGYMRPDLSPLYRFLCDLQNQGGIQVPYFSWGGLSVLGTLPRVRIGRAVLVQAQWYLTNAECKTISDLDRFDAFLKIKAIQNERRMPRWVMLMEGDSALPVDLDNPLSVDSLVQLLRRSPEAKLVEMYPQPGRQCVTGPEGGYEHELVIPMAKKQRASKATSIKENQAHNEVKHVSSLFRVQRSERLLTPQSNWGFVKIYGGPSLLDELLAGELASLLFSLTADRSLERWFFVRYADPEPHIRLRLDAPNREAYSKLNLLFESELAARRVWKIQFDTYQREIERYGGIAGTLASEAVFCSDSEAVLAVLRTLEGDEGLDMRWRIALLGIDALLKDCGLDINARLRQIGQLRRAFEGEFGLSAIGKQNLGDRFRRERSELHAMLYCEAPEITDAYRPAYLIYKRRSMQVRPAVATLRSLELQGELTCEFANIIGSYVHMHVNRLIRSSPRAHELVLYEFLYRLYDGECARKKRSASQGSSENF